MFLIALNTLKNILKNKPINFLLLSLFILLNMIFIFYLKYLRRKKLGVFITT